MKPYTPVCLMGPLLFLYLPAGSLIPNPPPPPALEKALIPDPSNLSPLQIGQSYTRGSSRPVAVPPSAYRGPPRWFRKDTGLSLP
jgi:hypothetical protein